MKFSGYRRSSGSLWRPLGTWIIATLVYESSVHAQIAPATQRSRSATQAASSQPTTDGRAEGGRLFGQAKTLYEQGEYTDAAWLFQRAADTFDRESNPLHAAWTYVWLGDCSRELQDDEQAVVAYTKSVSRFSNLKHDQGLAANSFRLGKALHRLGRYEDAIPHFQAAVAAYEKIDKPTDAAWMLSMLGDCQRDLKDDESAVAAYTKSVRSFVELNNDHGVADDASDLGKALYRLKRHNDAIPHLLAAATAYERIGDAVEAAWMYDWLGFGYRRIGEPDKAEDQFEESLRRFVALEHAQGIATEHASIARLLHDLERYRDAIPHFRAARDAYTRVKDLVSAAVQRYWLGVSEYYLPQSAPAPGPVPSPSDVYSIPGFGDVEGAARDMRRLGRDADAGAMYESFAERLRDDKRWLAAIVCYSRSAEVYTANEAHAKAAIQFDQIARCQAKARNFAGATAATRLARAAYSLAGDASGGATAALECGRAVFNRSTPVYAEGKEGYAIARQWLSLARDELAVLGDRAGAAESALLAILCDLNLGRRDSLDDAFLVACEQLKNTGHVGDAAHFAYRFAESIAGKFDAHADARQWYERAAKWSLETKHQNRHLWAQYQIARCDFELSSAFSDALLIALTHKHVSKSRGAGVAVREAVEMAIFLSERGAKELARKFYELATQLADQHGQPELLTDMLASYAGDRIDAADYEAARALLLRRIELVSADPDELADTRLRLARLSESTGDHAGVLEEISKIDLAVVDTRLTLDCLRMRAQAQVQLEHLSAALHTLRRAAALWSSLGDQSISFEAPNRDMRKEVVATLLRNANTAWAQQDYRSALNGFLDILRPTTRGGEPGPLPRDVAPKWAEIEAEIAGLNGADMAVEDECRLRVQLALLLGKSEAVSWALAELEAGIDGAVALVTGWSRLALLLEAASVAEFAGKYELALDWRRRVVDEAEGADENTLLKDRRELADLFASAGQYADSLALYQKTLKAIEELGADADLERASCLVRLGRLQLRLGLVREASEAISDAYELRKRLLGFTHADTVMAMTALADARLRNGEFDAARELYQSTLLLNAGSDASLGLGRSLYAVGQYENAASQYELLVNRLTGTGRERHDDMAAALHELALCRLRLGNEEQAQECWTRSVDIIRSRYGDKSPLLINRLARLGRLYEIRGSLDLARASLDESRRISQHYVRSLLPTLVGSEQFRFLRAEDRPSLEEALRVAARHPDEPTWVRVSAEWILNGKGLVNEVLALGVRIAREIPEASQLVGELRQVRESLASIEFRDETRSSEQRTTMAAREVELQRSVGELIRKHIAEPEWLDFESVRDALPRGGALVDYIRIDADPDTGTAAQYLAVVVAAELDQPQFITLPLPAQEIDTHVARLRNAITRQSRDSKQFSDRLAAAVSDPVLTLLPGGVKSLIVIPDDQLWMIPFAALPTPNRKRLLLQDLVITYATSGRDVLATRSRRRTSTPPVVFADPAYDLSSQPVMALATGPRGKSPGSRSRGFDKWSWARLRGTEIEARRIAPLLRKLVDARPLVLKRQEALESKFKSLASPRALVMSTHGFFLADTAQPGPRIQNRRGSLDLSNLPVALAAPRDSTIEYPLLRCGLVLAGANSARNAATANDGILTGLEILNVDLRGTELVVLSACETGVGRVHSGEGVAGLRQAFQLAGAGTVVSTLWKIPDRETADLMEGFFEDMVSQRDTGHESINVAEAMRRVQLKMLVEEKRRLYYWAAFTVTGDPHVSFGDTPIH